MKKITFILLALITGTTFAQNSDQATAIVNAEIVAPISVTADGIVLDFGKIASDGTGGDVTISTAGARTIPGAMKVGGNTGYTVPTFTVSHGTSLFYNVVTSVSNPTGGLLTLSAVTTDLVNETNTDADSFKVGATLSVPASTSAGTYNDGSITVTVTYN